MARRRGFTLVEVLVATALLALLMVGLLTAMRSFAQTEVRVDERVRSDEDMRVGERFLRAVLATASPRLRASTAGAPAQVDFAGSADSLRWIGVMPARHGAGGLYRFHLHARPASGDEPAAMVLEFFPYVPGFDAPLQPADLQSRVMASPVGNIALRYQDDLKSGENWLEEWPHADRLPRRVSLSVAGSSRHWPELVVTVIPVVGPGGVGRIAAGPASGPRVGPF